MNCITLKLFFNFFFYLTDRPNLLSGGRWETKHFIGMALRVDEILIDAFYIKKLRFKLWTGPKSNIVQRPQKIRRESLFSELTFGTLQLKTFFC